MSRWGASMPFDDVVDEMARHYQVTVSEATVRRATYETGEAAEALVQEDVARREKGIEAAPACENNMIVSADGTLIGLVNGEWREVKSVVVGEFSAMWDEASNETQVNTENMSYFSRSYRVREFERQALAELHQRGVTEAKTVVAVNDGAEWIQSFIDYHCPQAVRIIDFSHTMEYIAAAGKAVWGEGTPQFEQWYERMAHQLKHKPPAQTVAELRLLQPKAKTDEQRAILDRAIFYIQTRLSMMDYPHFRTEGYPIGSGSVESSHKFVVHKRLKQAGMRWAEHHVDPMLSLRNLLCNNRWDDTWPEIVAYRQRNHKRRRSRRQQPEESATPDKPITFADVEVAPEDASHTPRTTSKENHPWRRGLWPTRESWRWSRPHLPK
jgi:hypothetical protein